MEVTRSNFKSVLPQVRDAIEDSAFISFDTEFTGLNIKDVPSVGPYDTAAEAYEKLKQCASFSIIQFGLCTFHEGSDGRLTHRAYNFYTIPTHETFLCQTESLKFLVNHGMDLNKVFKEGITSLKNEDRAAKLAGLEEKLKGVREGVAKQTIQNLQANDGQKEVLAAAKNKIKDFLACEEEEELPLGNLNSFQRLLLYQMVQSDFDEKVFLITRRAESRNASLFAYKGGHSEKIRREEDQIKSDIEELQEGCGMNAILSAIKNSGKIVVGHNMLLDVIHTLHQFTDNVPDDLNQFKKLVLSAFPRLIDTKTLATQTQIAEKLESSALEPMVKCLQQHPFNLTDADPVNGCAGYTVNGNLAHEAGYDAYLTGLCFVTMLKYLDAGNTDFTVKTASPVVLQPHMNKIPYVFYGNPPVYLDLERDEPVVNRDHVFHMLVPTHWNSGDVSKLYSPYGGAKISWINNRECYVALNKKCEAKKVKTIIGKASAASKNFSLQTLASYKQEKKNENKRRRGDSDRAIDKQASKKQKGDKERDSPPRAVSPFESASWSDDSSSSEKSMQNG
ncbi:poly(A)-specific ribonuclease PARN-like isoform X2 [Cloeon dipterum]|uniref:poly(A)-specific ribonuclease PARN-like isoform X2 n=1 Tax=Cloeon dipterum TaxID=197152 RepID=UPI00322068C9